MPFLIRCLEWINYLTFLFLRQCHKYFIANIFWKVLREDVDTKRMSQLISHTRLISGVVAAPYANATRNSLKL